MSLLCQICYAVSMEEKTRRTMAAKILNAARRSEARTCEVCGAVRMGIRQRKYCSNACRQKAKYQRKRQANTD